MIIIWPDEKKKTKPSHIIIFPGALYWLFAAVFFFLSFHLLTRFFSFRPRLFSILIFFKGFTTNAAFFVQSCQSLVGFFS